MHERTKGAHVDVRRPLEVLLDICGTITAPCPSIGLDAGVAEGARHHASKTAWSHTGKYEMVTEAAPPHHKSCVNRQLSTIDEDALELEAKALFDATPLNDRTCQSKAQYGDWWPSWSSLRRERGWLSRFAELVQ